MPSVPTAMTPPADPRPLWVPGATRRRNSRLGRWLTDLDAAGRLGQGAATQGRTGATTARQAPPGADWATDARLYQRAWEWSVTHPEDFWTAVATHLGIAWSTPPAATLEVVPGQVEGATWFPGGRINYGRLALAGAGAAGSQIAVVARSQTRPDIELRWDDLRRQVARIASGLAAAGVGPGDRVAAYLPNIPETVVAFLATASLGAIWTCCAPEVGVTGALDRLAQVEPMVLLAVDGYRYGARAVDRREQAVALRRRLPTVAAAIWVAYLDPGSPGPDGWDSWDALGTDRQAPTVEVAASHPLYILYSSGTTGRPKAIVHGHGGIAVEHAKAWALHFDAGPDDRCFWFSTTGWMMWNFLVSSLLVGAGVVLFDGDPGWPDAGSLWEMVDQTGATVAGVGAAFLVAAQKAGVRPREAHGLSRLRTLGSTGSPLPAAAARWVYDAVADPDRPDLLLGSFSGGTDVCTGFVGPSPTLPVWADAMSCRCLGAAVDAYDDAGHPVVGHEGELVLTAPLPSMPVGFWGEAGAARYHEAYHARFPGVWAHGDRLTVNPNGTCTITGRSDGTLNRGGVRMGTAEFYAVVERHPGVADSLVVHLPATADDQPDELWLFVVPAGEGDQDRLRADLRTALSAELSPRHVPDHLVFVGAVPRTLSGKKLEVPVKRILAGEEVDTVLTRASVANPTSLDAFVAVRRPRPGTA